METQAIEARNRRGPVKRACSSKPFFPHIRLALGRERGGLLESRKQGKLQVPADLISGIRENNRPKGVFSPFWVRRFGKDSVN
jgi:hypothetical protein